ncbi:hypothetical protein [Pseudarthrobacter sp. BIM B-2242]|uniref:hypothetical protein n=1 Tax=Pseudarthrobacter sp. BIM B-2242 TaxID=2772401 RepID=UPI00168A5EBA|nr:hypothetical protein [Pseudarthrobacter sp. BIM B-2242]QOD04384.1 hypothetical protein IDT60_04800 [Pseudarthrobacter sp. BIM B-2242]
MGFDDVFLGSAAVMAEHGICEAPHAQTRLKEVMVGRGNVDYVRDRRVFVLPTVFLAAASLRLASRHPWAG